MLGDLMKRLVNAAVLFIAAIMFFVVPVGKKTLAQHFVAIFSTPPAREAASACVDVGRRAVGRATVEIETLRRAHEAADAGAPEPLARSPKAPPAPEAELPPAD